MTQPRHPRGPPMDLANMRRQGVRSAYCGHHRRLRAILATHRCHGLRGVQHGARLTDRLSACPNNATSSPSR